MSVFDDMSIFKIQRTPKAVFASVSGEITAASEKRLRLNLIDLENGGFGFHVDIEAPSLQYSKRILRVDFAEENLIYPCSLQGSSAFFQGGRTRSETASNEDQLLSLIGEMGSDNNFKAIVASMMARIGEKESK